MADNPLPGDRGNAPLRILVFSGSMRADSLNTKLALLAKAAIEKHGGRVDFASMREFDCPSYDGDLETKSGIPQGAQEFQRRLLANDAFILACPEYNGSMPGLVKNTIDWTSRFRPQPFNEKHGMLLSASPSMMGGNRSLWSLRVPFEHLGARIFPDMFSLATAHQALDAEGRIASATLQQRFDATVAAFLDLVEAARNYPCMKKAWVEFLGQQPDPVRDRME